MYAQQGTSIVSSRDKSRYSQIIHVHPSERKIALNHLRYQNLAQEINGELPSQSEGRCLRKGGCCPAGRS